MKESTHVWPLLKKNVTGVDWERIENSCSTGAPDVNGCYQGVDAWIENKIVHGKRIKFQPTQPGWITLRTNHGGRVFVLARKDDELRLYPGSAVKSWAMDDSATVLADGCISVIPKDPLFTMPVGGDYMALRTMIFGK